MKAFQNRKPGSAMVVVAATVALSFAACSPSSTNNGQQAPASTAANTQSPASSAPAAFVAYAGSIPAAATNKQCALDNISGQVAGSVAQLHAGANVLFVGWAGNGKGQVTNGFLLVLKGSQLYSVPLAMNVARPDVAKALSSDDMANSGYQVNASLSGVASGAYHVFITDSADASNTCDTNRDVMVQ